MLALLALLACINSSMNFLSTKSRMAIGQVSLVVSILMTASLLGLMPDRIAAVRDGRAALAEARAAT